MESSVKQRIMEFLKYKGIGQGKFEKEVGLSNGYMNQLRHSPGADKLQMILSTYPELDEIWLRTGKGDMIKSNGSNKSNSSSAITYFPNVDGSMGGVQFIENPDEMRQDIIIPGYSDCKFAINAYGDSMSPLIKSGQIVLLSEWQERFIDWGKIYLVVTMSGYRAIKRLFPGCDAEHVLCKSENEVNNPPFEVEREDIVKIYLVKGWICRDVI